ncbi:mucolipin-3-like [Condylostylus longicornis]|uniref:mucolipin-3-like n=1 Tax=Condylostylus longicornis TaxID=2530218 RepID=UPI00244E14FD|nr:mucolipin-3-like [Condylostylus longicornis]
MIRKDNLSQENVDNYGCESDEDYRGAFKTNQNFQSSVNNLTEDQSITSETSTRPITEPCEETSGLSPFSFHNENRMRRKLQFFFMNPIEKWRAKRRFPYKFVVQVVKIVLVTMQLCLFAHSRYNHVNYTGDNRITFSHLFLKGWDSYMEVEAYPPSAGPLAIYEKSEFFETIDYATIGYSNLSRSIGPYSYPSSDNTMAPMKLCLYTYREGQIFGFNESYVFNPEIDKLCVSLTEDVTRSGVEVFLKSKDIVVNFSALVKATLRFAIKTVNFKAYGPFSAPDCYKFNIEIIFDNGDHDGQTLISLTADALRLYCKGDVKYVMQSSIDSILRSVLNYFVILICVISFSLCARAIYRAQLLRIQTQNFFWVTYRKPLSFDGKMEFVNFWYIMICCNDVLLIIGSALKEQIERRFTERDSWDICSVFLGIGNLLVWFGVLRYLGFFKTYNVVILTLKKAAPKIVRFLLCALLIYGGFTFCGWLVLGPYHMKFRSLAMTSECLFSLINGDDMFATFTTMSNKSQMLWWFCRIYLYSFISLYIYVVLSLFISVIMDAYDTIKRYYRDGFPQSDLKQFVGSSSLEDLTSGIFQEDFDDFGNDSMFDILKKIFDCCKRRDPSPGPTGYTSLNNKTNISGTQHSQS